MFFAPSLLVLFRTCPNKKAIILRESNLKEIGNFMINIITVIPLKKSINGKRATGCCEHVFIVNIINS